MVRILIEETITYKRSNLDKKQRTSNIKIFVSKES